jgi:septum formation protein
MSIATQFVLASGSPRRREILVAMGFAFETVSVDVDEQRLANESAEEMVLRLAIAKAQAATRGEIVLGADTVVVLGDRVLGKPLHEDDAVDMLLALSGKTHTVLTGVALKTPTGTHTKLSSTKVRFREIGQDEARRYWQSGEPADKAGSYGIQGIGGMFVESISGSYSGVMGLPVFETVELLGAAGISVLADDK